MLKHHLNYIFFYVINIQFNFFSQLLGFHFNFVSGLRIFRASPLEEMNNGFARNEISGFSIHDTLDIRPDIFIGHHQYVLLEKLFIRAPMEKPSKIFCVRINFEYLISSNISSCICFAFIVNSSKSMISVLRFKFGFSLLISLKVKGSISICRWITTYQLFRIRLARAKRVDLISIESLHNLF